MPLNGEARAVIVGADLLMRSRLEETARAAGLTPETHATMPPPGEPPTVLVVDLDAASALDGIAAWRERWPQLRIVGFVSHVDVERTEAARSLGCVVYPRGASARNDPKLLLPDTGAVSG